MQTRTDTAQDALSARHVATSFRVAMPQDAFEVRHQPGRQLGVVDGLVSVTQRAWGLYAETGARDAATVTQQ
jgi:hypothetical protein